MVFKIIIDNRAFKDVDDAVEYYHKISPQLTKRFVSDIRKSIKALSKNPFFQIRYKDYRCLPLKNFPFMIHYLVDEKKNVVHIYALINTSKDIDKWL